WRARRGASWNRASCRKAPCSPLGNNTGGVSRYSSDAPPDALGGLDVWLLWGFADLAQPVCRAKDEPRPTCAIVHACSRVASRNGAAGYKLMRSSHATWTSTLNPSTTSIPRQTEKTTTRRHRPFFAPA